MSDHIFFKWFKKIIIILFIILFISHIAIIILSGKIILTPLFFISFFILFGFACSRFIKSKKYVLILWIFIFVITIYEFHLRTSESYKHLRGYIELNGFPLYVSMYRFHNLWGTEYVPMNNADSSWTESKTDYTIKYTTNNLGLRMVEDVSIRKPRGEVRLITIGDSNVQGIGAPDGSTFSDFLQKYYRNKYSTDLISVINCGKSGNDPIECLYGLKTNFIRLQPNMVILVINNSDINDVLCRGGNNRFSKNKEILRKGPWWEFFYGSFFIIRNFVRKELNYTRYLIPEDSIVNEQLFACNEIVNCVEDFNVFCKKRNISFIVVILPNQYEMEKAIRSGHTHGSLLDGMDFIYENIVEKNIQTIYLPECYFEKMNGMNLFPNEFYWKNDYHHNSKGYQLFAVCVGEQLEIPLFHNNNNNNTQP